MDIEVKKPVFSCLSKPEVPFATETESSHFFEVSQHLGYINQKPNVEFW